VKAVVLLSLVTLLAPVVAYSDAPVLTGKTAASAELLPKIREGLGDFAPIFISCANVDSIVVGTVPNGFDPKQIAQVPATLVPPPRNPRYELWTISGCGHSAGIIVVLWTADTGKAMFTLNPLSPIQ